jgi:molybdopterin/thiamine biosynthesis adenylyltransferase
MAFGWLRKGPLIGSRPKLYRSKPVRSGLRKALNETQGKVTGFNLDAMQRAHIGSIGAGGIGSNVGAALARKGVGQITFFDPDLIEWKNTTRQLFDRQDVGHFKTERLARRLSEVGLFPGEFRSVPMHFEEALERGYDFGTFSLLIAGVDNNPSRRAACVYGLEQGIPVIHAAVSVTGGELYVMVQEPGAACWGCAFPHSVNDESYPCNLPGILDVLQVCSGLIVYAVDTLLSDRPRHWNVREVFLDGSLPDRTRTAPRRADCAVCGSDVAGGNGKAMGTRHV